MANDEDENKKDGPAIPAESDETGVNLDNDLEGDLGEIDEEASDSVDALLSEMDPSFSKDLEEISAKDFAGVVIEKDSAAEDVNESAKAPSAFRNLVANLPSDLKNRYMAAGIVVVVMIPLAALIYMGKILPRFELPYVVSMNELTKDVYTYPTDGVKVPLFDEFRVKSFTYTFPQTKINLKTANGTTAYAQFEFFLNLRDEGDGKLIDERQSEIMDMIQRVLEEMSWRDLQSPIGKEKVKKVVRHQINEYLQGNHVIGVYYRSVILQK